jgi:hypothetical protein
MMTIEQIKAEAARRGNYWFSANTMKWWKTRVSNRVYTTNHENVYLFVQSDAPFDFERQYSVQVVDLNRPDADLIFNLHDATGEARRYSTRAEAHAVARKAHQSLRYDEDACAWMSD